MKKLGMTSIKINDLDYAEELIERQNIVLGKELLKSCYEEWYLKIKKDLEDVSDISGLTVELGSGGGFLKEYVPDLITSDVSEGVADMVITAPSLPLENNSVKALILVNVFHHIPNISLFLSECERVLVENGVVLIVDPSHTPFARFLLKNFHTERYDDTEIQWDFKGAGRANDANQAITWNIFKRDYEKFQFIYNNLKVDITSYFKWLSYILSGGVTGNCYVPRFLFGLVFFLDRFFKPLNRFCSLFWSIKITKVS